MKLLIKDLVLGSGAPDELQSPALSDYYDTLTSGIGFDLVENGSVNSCGIGYTDATEIDVELLLKDCVASWNCDDGSGTTLTDNSGNGHDGTLENFGPVAEYHFDGDLTDEQGGSALSVIAGSATYETGVEGQGCGGCSLRDSNATPGLTGSIAFWAKFDTLSNSANVLDYAEIDKDRIFIRHDQSAETNSKYDWYIRDATSGNYKQVNATGDIVLDTFQHFVATWDNGTVTFYLDGELIGSVEADTAGWYPADQLFHLGISYSDTGQVNDDFRIYDYALSADEIAALYNRPQQPSHFPDGISGKALSFDGVDDYVEVPHDSAIDFERTDAFSISLWIKSTPTADSYILYKSTGGTNSTPGYGLYSIFAESQLRFYLSGTTNGNDLIKDFDWPTSYTSGNWTHLVITYDGSVTYDGIKLYANGTELTGYNVRNTLTETIKTSATLKIANATFDGLLDEVRIFNRALTAAEVKFLYNNPGSMDTVAVADSPDANGLYLLDTTFDNDALEFGRAIISHDGSYIGRIALGFARSLGVAPTREAGFYTTESPRVTAAGQIIPGAGGMHGRRIAVDFRYKIDSDIFDDIEDAIEYISKGYPWFMAFTAKEQDRLPWPRLYASPESPEILLQSSVNRFLYSKQFDFLERF